MVPRLSKRTLGVCCGICASVALALLFEVMTPVAANITKQSVKFARPQQG
jgi:hypothetical protein